MISRFWLFIAFALTTSHIHAEGEQCLVVFLKSGTKVTLPISDEPKITFDGTVMRVGNGDYQIENVRKWMVGEPELLDIENATDKGDIMYRDGILTVGGSASVHVYNAAGVEQSVSVKNQGAGLRTADLSALPAGVYVIKAGKETLKIQKR